MIELSVIRDLVAIFGVIAGFTYYVLIVRNARETKQREQVFLRFQSFDKTYQDAIEDVWDQEWGSTIEEFRSHSPEHRANFNYVQVRYNNLGVMLKHEMMDLDLFFQIFPIGNIVRFWEKMEDIILDYRETTNDVSYNEGFEYLYNEITKRFPDIGKR